MMTMATVVFLLVVVVVVYHLVPVPFATCTGDDGGCGCGSYLTGQPGGHGVVPGLVITTKVVFQQPGVVVLFILPVVV